MADEETHAGHRQRLRERLLKDGAGRLADYELLEYLLFGANARSDTKALAKQLLQRFGGLPAVFAADPVQLRDVKGLGEAGVALLKAIQGAAVRLARLELEQRPLLTAWQQVLDYCRIALAHEGSERFHVLYLDRKNHLIADEVQQVGTVDQVTVYPREVVKRALNLGATALILVHNHPSGDPTPSRADVAMTNEVVSAAKPLGIAVHDHVVVARKGVASFRSLGLL